MILSKLSTKSLFRKSTALLSPFSLLLGLAVAAFFLSYIAPGDPARLMLGSNAPPESVASLREEMGFNRPVSAQFLEYFTNLLVGDFGTSWSSRQPVLREISEHLAPTVWLGFLASLYSLSIALATNAAIFYFPKLDHLALPTLRIGIALPSFVVAVIMAVLAIRLQEIFALSASRDNRQYILPAIAVAIYPACVMTAVLRDRFAGIFRAPYFRTSVASGFTRGQLFSRVLLRNGWSTLLSAWVNQISLLVFTTVVVEWFFSLRGIGSLLIRSIQGKDLPVLSGILLLNGIFFLCVRFFSGEHTHTHDNIVSKPQSPSSQQCRIYQQN